MVENRLYERTSFDIAIVFIVIISVCILVYWNEGRCRYYTPSELVYSTEEYTCVIEEITVHNYISIKGYAYKNGESIKTANSFFVLKDTVSGTYIQIPTQIIEDIRYNEIAGNEYENKYAGLLGLVNTSKLQKGRDYVIGVGYGNNNDATLIMTEERLQVGDK